LRKDERRCEQPHNVPFVILGSSLLWFGWYGFNAGSALIADNLAGLAFVNTTLSAAASISTWTLLCWIRGYPSTAVGKACAALIGLVGITAIIFTTVIGTALILYILKFFISIRPTPEEELTGSDRIEHGESAYT